jgi:elongation factor 1-alpha
VTAAIGVIPASLGEFEASLSKNSFFREALAAVVVYGIKNIVMVVNKMDDSTVNYSEDRYNEILKESSRLFKRCGLNPDKLLLIPISAWKGINITQRSDVMKWYNGPVLIDALREFKSTCTGYTK